jgi:hypothetical protein
MAAPWWNWAVSPLATILTGGFGGSSANTDRKFELQSMGQLQKMAGPLGTMGTTSLQGSTRDMQSIMNQLQKIMGGGQAGLEAVAPQVNTVASQYQSGRRAAAELSPRGGGRTAALSDTGFSEMRDIQNMMFKEQGQARGLAGSLAESMANLGLGETSTAAGMAEAAANIASGHAAQQAKSDAAMGQGIGQLLGLMMMAGG